MLDMLHTSMRATQPQHSTAVAMACSESQEHSQEGEMSSEFRSVCLVSKVRVLWVHRASSTPVLMGLLAHVYGCGRLWSSTEALGAKADTSSCLERATKLG